MSSESEPDLCWFCDQPSIVHQTAFDLPRCSTHVAEQAARIERRQRLEEDREAAREAARLGHCPGLTCTSCQATGLDRVEGHSGFRAADGSWVDVVQHGERLCQDCYRDRSRQAGMPTLDQLNQRRQRGPVEAS